MKRNGRAKAVTGAVTGATTRAATGAMTTNAATSAVRGAATSAARGAATRMPARLPGLDALRGLAILAMAAYHFGFDLRWFGLARFDLEHDARWIAARSMILGSFLLIAGASLVLASQRADFTRRFPVRLAQILGAALLVSVASRLAFPATWIWFGVLHAIAVSLVLAWPLAQRPRVALALGVGIVLAGLALAHPTFDAPLLKWVGFMTHKPATEDYVPLFPWAGLVLVGVALGHGLRARPGVLDPLARLPRALRFLGRHSLVVYLVHQPLLIALLWLATRA